MPDHDDLETRIKVALGLDVNLADQRAGRIYIDHLAALGFGGYGLGDAVGGKDDRAIVRAIAQLFDKDGALFAQAIDHEFIVYDFVTHIDWRAPFLQGHFDNLDGAVNTRAKPAWGSEINRQGLFGHGAFLKSCAIGKAFSCPRPDKGGET